MKRGSRSPVQMPLLDRNATRVVNLRLEPGWKTDHRFVYVGRKQGVDPRKIRAGDLGSYGNPFDVREHGEADALRLCEEAIRDRMRRERPFFFAVRRLEGKILSAATA